MLELEWRIEINRINFKRSLIIRCPQCGREGRLISAKPPKMTGRSFRVLHDDGSNCKIAWTHPAWEAVSEVYSKVRKQEIDTIKVPASKKSVRGYRCPYPGCDYTSTFYGLIRHIKVRHPINGHCPLCGKPMKHINHLRYSDDPEHQLLYMLYSSGRLKREELLKMVEVTE